MKKRPEEFDFSGWTEDQRAVDEMFKRNKWYEFLKITLCCVSGLAFIIGVMLLGKPHDTREIWPGLGIYAIPTDDQVRWLMKNPDRLHKEVFDEEFGLGQADINIKWATDGGLDN